MRISDWSSDVCSSDLAERAARGERAFRTDRLYRAGIDHQVAHDPRRSGEPLQIHVGSAPRPPASAGVDAIPRHRITPFAGRHTTHPRGQNSLLRGRSEEHTSELQSLMRISYAVFCLKKKKQIYHNNTHI